MTKNIVIVDDHILISKALSEVVGQFEEYEVLYACHNGRELQEKILQKGVPDIVLLDISMPIMNGFETAAWLTENHPDVFIMALSMHDDDVSVIKMIRNGAKGYMLKNSSPKELKHALFNMITNGFYYPDWAASIVYSSISEEKQRILHKTNIHFTDREIEFLKLTITELSYKEIADIMNCSPRTIDSYRDNLFDKLKVKTRVGLAVFTMKNGLIE